MRVEDFIIANGLECRQADDGGLQRRTKPAIRSGFRLGHRRLVNQAWLDDRPTLWHRVPEIGRAADTGHLPGMFALRGTMRDLDDGPFGVAVNQKVGTTIEQHRTAHLFRPVIVLGNAAQRRLDAANDDRRVLEGFATTLTVDDDGAVGAFSRRTARRVAVIVPNPPVRRVVVDHGIHVSGGNAEKQIWFSQGSEGVRAGPVWLRDDADAEALRLPEPPDNRHAETGMVNIGVARHHDDIAGIPAKRIHLPPGHRQERRRAQAMSPETLVGKQVFRGSHHDLREARREVTAWDYRWQVTSPGTSANSAGAASIRPS